MFRTIALWVILGLMTPPALSDNLAARVSQVLDATPLIDGHNDLPWQFKRRTNNQLTGLDISQNLTLIEPSLHTDIPRLRTGMVGGLFWSVYVPIREYGGSPLAVQQVIEQIDLVKRLVARYPDDFALAMTAAEVRQIHGNGQIASLIGIEGGHAIHNSLATLRQLYNLGARYMTLTHSKGLLWADSATDKAHHGGLTSFGEAVVKEMNRLGMLVDLSHVSMDTMRDALEVSKAPVIFSHSSAFTVTQHPRNVPDDVLRQVTVNRGVVMVNYLTSYISEPMRKYRLDYEAKRDGLTGSESEIAEEMRVWVEARPAPEVTLYDVADHIDHMVNIAGIDHVGLGADYDGMPPGPVGLEDVSTYPALLKELLIRGYSDKDIAKIAGENILRVMAEAEAVAASLQSLHSPAEIQFTPPESSIEQAN